MSPEEKCIGVNFLYVFRADKLLCCNGEKLYSQDVHISVLHPLLVTLLRSLLLGQVPLCRTDCKRKTCLAPIFNEPKSKILNPQWWVHIVDGVGVRAGVCYRQQTLVLFIDGILKAERARDEILRPKPKEAWSNIPKATINKLINLSRRRAGLHDAGRYALRFTQIREPYFREKGLLHT